MVQKIIRLLQEIGINTYLVEEQKEESVELFFVRQILDMNRRKQVKKYAVTVYRDFSKNEVAMRGSSTANLYTSMTEEEMKGALVDAYYAASFVSNPYYDLPIGTKEEPTVMASTLASYTLEESAKLLTKALFKKDTDTICFLNSAEIFVYKTTRHYVNAQGIDVSYEKYRVEGEFVAQCTSPQDVESYKSFSYENLETEALEKLVEDTLKMTKARAEAKVPPKKGGYKVILSGEYVKTILSYYLERAGANMVYPKYSNFKIGDMVQGEDILGDVLDITVKADVPYSSEGIKMIDRSFMKAGKLEMIHGPSRFAYYLGIEPTGYYTSIKLHEGTMSIQEMEEGEYLHVVNFSDFQMDPFTGSFGGEIRLGFYSDGDKVIPVTGGSISGEMRVAQKNLRLSKEMHIEKNYEGPYAICLHSVKIAGE